MSHSGVKELKKKCNRLSFSINISANRHSYILYFDSCLVPDILEWSAGYELTIIYYSFWLVLISL